jgi:hypothetical protein
MAKSKHNQFQSTSKVVLFLSIILSFALANAQKPKGKLFIIGGGNRSDQLMQQLVDLSQFKKNRLHCGFTHVE